MLGRLLSRRASVRNERTSSVVSARKTSSQQPASSCARERLHRDRLHAYTIRAMSSVCRTRRAQRSFAHSPSTGALVSDLICFHAAITARASTSRLLIESGVSSSWHSIRRSSRRPRRSNQRDVSALRCARGVPRLMRGSCALIRFKRVFLGQAGSSGFGWTFEAQLLDPRAGSWGKTCRDHSKSLGFEGSAQPMRFALTPCRRGKPSARHPPLTCANGPGDLRGACLRLRRSHANRDHTCTPRPGGTCSCA
ncbi:MAG: hypothetical protein CHACPFDD_03395 [Phycisphaerae bacterium]|nr:hypothetical protein [Phycisphaerae bacterium]